MLYVTTANILSGKTTPSTIADIIRGPRIQDLKKLSIVIDFDPSGFNIVTDGPRRQMQLGAAFANIIDGTFDAMRGWKRDQVYLDLEIHEERSCGHHAMHYRSKLADRQGMTIDWVRSIRHKEYNAIRCRCCSFRGLLSMICSTMSKELRDIEFGFQRRDISNLSMFEEGFDFVPSGLKSLTVRNMAPGGYDPWDRRYGWFYPCSLSLVKVSQTLETLQISDPVENILGCKFGDIPSAPNFPWWPNLKSLP